MDRTSILVIAVCVVLLALWSLVLMPKLYPPRPIPAGATNAPVAAMSGTNQATYAPPPPVMSQATTPAPKPFAEAASPEELLVATNGNARYTFTSYGGGIKLVELTQYPETVIARRQKAPQTNRVATLNSPISLPTLALSDGGALEGNTDFKLSRTAE